MTVHLNCRGKGTDQGKPEHYELHFSAENRKYRRFSQPARKEVNKTSATIVITGDCENDYQCK